MTKGEVDCDAIRAREAANKIASGAEMSPDLFRLNEAGLAFEAKTAIWNAFQNFTEKADQLATAAEAAADAIESVDDLRLALRSIGGVCQACHREYGK